MNLVAQRGLLAPPRRILRDIAARVEFIAVGHSLVGAAAVRMWAQNENRSDPHHGYAEGSLNQPTSTRHRARRGAAELRGGL